MFYRDVTEEINAIVNQVNELRDKDHRDPQYDFNRFFMMQYIRSKSMQNSIRSSFGEFQKCVLHEQEINSFLPVVVSINIAERLALNVTQNADCVLDIYRNDTAVPFVTGDTPIVNLLWGMSENEMSMYYPISPSFAVELMITPRGFKKNIREGKLIIIGSGDENRISTFNKAIVDNYVNEVYSSEYEILENEFNGWFKSYLICNDLCQGGVD